MFNRKSAMVSTSVAAMTANTDTGTDTEPGIGHNQPPLDTEALKAKALFVAGKEDEATEQAVEVLTAARNETAVGAIRIMLALVANHGSEEMLTWPKPDTDTGTNPAIFKVPVEKDGKSKMERIDWWNLYSDNTPRGKALAERKAHLVNAGKDGANKSGIPEDILDMNSVKRAQELDVIDGQIQSNRNGHKEAGRLFFQFDAVKSLPEVDCAPIWAEDEQSEVERTKKPIMVWRIPAEGQPISHFRHFSVGAFMKLKVAEAQENGGSYKALMATVDRGTGSTDSGSGGKEQTPAIKTMATGLSRFVEVFRWFDEISEAKDQEQMGKLIKLLKSKDADELNVTFWEMGKMIGRICEEAGVADRYAKIRKNNPGLTASAETKAA